EWVGAFGAFCKVLRPDTSKVDPRYLSYFFYTDYYRSVISHLAKGANINNINNSHFDELFVPLPPLETQKKIAAVLDQADALRQKRRQSIQKLDELTQSVFLEMFGDQVTNTKGTKVLPIKKIAQKEKYSIKAGPFGSALKKEFYTEDGYKIYGQEQVIRDDLTYGDYYINR